MPPRRKINPKVVCVAFLSVTIAVILIVVLTLHHTSAAQEDCHQIVSGLEAALALLATKRPYHFDPLESSELPYYYTPEGCQAEKLWYFGRHGTRYPGDEDIEAMHKILPRLYDEIVSIGSSGSFLCPSTLSYFTTWTPRADLNISTESYLHAQGIHEISSISTRYKTRYPNLFPSRFSNSTYLFKSTNSQRTVASARAFASSIFGSLDRVYFPKPISKDPILKFYSACPKWEKEVEKGPKGSKEHEDFGVSFVMNGTIARVSKRLGLSRNLTLDEIVIVYTTCAFETAWNNGSISHWCAVFDLEDLAVMEYHEDLEYFWKDGPSFPINYEQACPPFKDALQFFDSSPRKVTAYFSHSGATLKMFARLGIFNGTGASPMEIRANNYEQMKDMYEWRTGKIDFMATNMALVQYSCDEEEPKIGLFTQERATPFPGCAGKAFCNYDEFKERISAFTGDCNLQEICRV